MSTPTFQSKAAKHLPFEIAAKIRAVSADRLISAFGHRRASFIQQAELAFAGPSIGTVDLRRTAEHHSRQGEVGMDIISRGFSGRRSPENAKLPPGQYLTTDFPVLSAGPTPHVPLDRWEFTIDDGTRVLRR